MSGPAAFCGYCGGNAELVGGDVVYPHRPDLRGRRFWRCAACDAYVGTHRNSQTHAPLGRLAKAELRALRVQAHAAFDPLWQAKMRRDGCSKSAARRAAYKWLAGELGMAPGQCHISWMDEDGCRRVIGVICDAKTDGAMSR